MFSTLRNHVFCTVCFVRVYPRSSDPTLKPQTKCVRSPELSSGRTSASPAAMALAPVDGDLGLNPTPLTSTTWFALEAGPRA
jgi:hypothetical protein